MRNLFVLILLLTTSLVNAQIETPPTGANFKSIPTYSIKHYTIDSTTWLYRGSTYGWMNLSKSKDLRLYRLLNNHDSLSTLQEKSYNSLNDLPDLSIYAPIDDPTFTTKITTPALNIPTSAAVNYFWKCTDAGTGAGTWANITTSQSYKGTVDGDDGIPTSGGSALIDGTGTAGWFYVCIDAGTYDYGNPSGNSITLALNDQIHYDGSIWQKIPAGASQWITTGSDIYYNSGKVIIGTTSPTSYSQLTIQSADAAGGTAVWQTFKNSAGATKWGFSEYASGDFNIYESGVADARLYLKAGGQIGINKQPDTETLDIDGTIQSDLISIYPTVDNYNQGIRIHPSPLGYSALVLGSDPGNTGTDVGQWSLLRYPVENGYPLIFNYNGSINFRFDPNADFTAYGIINAYAGNSNQWNTAYTHSQIAGGNSVHVSTTENTQWDAAYTHSQITGGNSVHVSTTENSNWDAAYVHTTDNTQAHSDYLLNNANDATSGTLTATNFILSSDKRLKKNISPIKKAFNIKFVQFNLKSEPDILRYGVIAQDVETYYPELVRTDASGMKSVAYIDLLIGKIHELEQRIEALEKSNESMQKKFNYFLNEK